ncbi:ABC transporter substrate-binding protein [Defluviitalea raffinosedens]|jgi:lactose/L-arabinose transport system substrate-binding protein|uniref:Extracellular solute-binding protein n=1 Tax=Defluviitalea raffinosedens TaxID=1450156 RepID=A0A7C8HJA7_9FIRM|nr:extracellular solute-binding protein [Defluviitalea raffinosedens]KAE9636184.1 extracellular solute-binding protein [Defluviitalea raffinosedens]MBM7684962.1 lactose/L-arabinose transport system substrate-binding protein [Defluviitalea raffinosedens]HHW68662.1 extracellular solute-binding protein [Candidatus Epulonipiscium sp.]
MKKKIISLLLTATMALSLAACGSGTQTNQSNQSGGNSQSTEAKTGSSSGSNELTVWCWDPAFNIYAMQEAEKVYQKDHPDFKLNIIETPWQDIQTKLTTAATSGDLSTLPDILLMQDNAFQKNVMSFPDVFVDLTNSGIAFDKFGASKVAYSTVDGKNYGVPFDNGAVIQALRTDVLEQAGFTIEDFTDITWSEYIEKAKVVLEKTGKPLNSCVAGESDLIMIMLQSAGSSLFNADGTPNIVNNQVLEEVIKTYVELIKSGVLVHVNDWDQYVGSFTNGTVAGTINGCWILGSIQTAEDQKGLWQITNMPKLDNISSATNYSNNGGSSWAITTNSKNKELAIDFLSKTFAGSVEFYETILPKSGALATYIPAGDSDVYGEPQEFFQNQAIYSMITDFASKVPSNNTGIYYYEARDAVATALSNVISGADLKAELETAESTVKFTMGQ